MSFSGKTLVEHLEAVNHAQAVEHIWQLAAKTTPKQITAQTILTIHSQILAKIDDTNADQLRRGSVRLAGSSTVFPNQIKLSELLDELVVYIQTARVHPCLKAAQAHLQLVSIHPFVDGNGRTARLLMNLMLLQAGFPPAIIRKQDWLNYLESLELAQTKDNQDPYCRFILKAIGRSLDIYLKPEVPTQPETELIKIGRLAQLAQAPVSTIRYWTDQGLLKPAELAASGYRWYDDSALKQIKKIRQLQAKRLSIKEIGQKLT